MLKTIFTKTLWEKRKAILFWCIGLYLYSLLIIAVYPAFGDQSAYADLVANMPEMFEAFVGELGGVGTVEGFLAMEHFNFMYPILMTILAVSLANGIIAKEEDAGTLELILSRPVKRTVFVLQKSGAMLFVLLIVGITGWLGIISGPLLVEVSVDISAVWWASIAGVLLSGVFGAMSLFLTALTNNRGLTSALTVLFFIASFFINTFSQMVDWLEPFQKLSVFYYYNALSVLTTGVNILHILILLAVSAAFIPLSIWIFRKRDIRV